MRTKYVTSQIKNMNETQTTKTKGLSEKVINGKKQWNYDHEEHRKIAE